MHGVHVVYLVYISLFGAQSWLDSSAGAWPSPPSAQYGKEEMAEWRANTWCGIACPMCQYENWVKAKKCKQCGVKRSYAAVAASAAWTSPREARPSDGAVAGEGTGVRATKVAHLKQLEAARAALHKDSHHDLPEHLAGQIALAKKEITACQPVAAQMANARSALARAEARRDRALETDRRAGPR